MCNVICLTIGSKIVGAALYMSDVIMDVKDVGSLINSVGALHMGHHVSGILLK